MFDQALNHKQPTSLWLVDINFSQPVTLLSWPMRERLLGRQLDYKSSAQK